VDPTEKPLLFVRHLTV